VLVPATAVILAFAPPAKAENKIAQSDVECAQHVAVVGLDCRAEHEALRLACGRVLDEVRPRASVKGNSPESYARLRLGITWSESQADKLRNRGDWSRLDSIEASNSRDFINLS
jgi:hypothetical protein